jgi:hypothetical protein
VTGPAWLSIAPFIAQSSYTSLLKRQNVPSGRCIVPVNDPVFTVWLLPLPATDLSSCAINDLLQKHAGLQTCVDQGPALVDNWATKDVEPVVVQLDVHVPDSNSEWEDRHAQNMAHSTTMAIGKANSPDDIEGLMAQVQLRSVLYPDFELLAPDRGGGGDPSVK